MSGRDSQAGSRAARIMETSGVNPRLMKTVLYHFRFLVKKLCAWYRIKSGTFDFEVKISPSLSLFFIGFNSFLSFGSDGLLSSLQSELAHDFH